MCVQNLRNASTNVTLKLCNLHNDQYIDNVCPQATADTNTVLLQEF